MKKELVIVLVYILFLNLGFISAQDYFIDSVNGDDINGVGTIINPWKSFANLISYYGTCTKPNNWVSLRAGDIIYLRAGVYSNNLVYGVWANNTSTNTGSTSSITAFAIREIVENYEETITGQSPSQQTSAVGDGTTSETQDCNPTGASNKSIALFKNINGNSTNPISIKAYLNETVILNPSYGGRGIILEQASYWNIEGIEISQAHERAIALKWSNDINVRGVVIHNTSNIANNPAIGLEILNSLNTEISYSTFYDNFNIADSSSDDNGNLVIYNAGELYGGNPAGNVTIYESIFYQTPFVKNNSGVCVKYNDGSFSNGTYFNVYNNSFENCKFMSFGTGTKNTHFHHNIIIGGERSILSRNFDGPTNLSNQLFEYNTIYNTAGFFLEPNENYGFPNNITFTNNIVYQQPVSGFLNPRIIQIHRGIEFTDNIYNYIINQNIMKIGNNCYFNPQESSNFIMQSATLGGGFELLEWTQLGGQNYDSDTLIQDPLFRNVATNDLRLENTSGCKNKGRYAGQTFCELDYDLPPCESFENDEMDALVAAWFRGEAEFNQVASSHDPWKTTQAYNAEQDIS